MFCWQADLLSLALLSYSVQQAFSDRVDLLPIAELQYYCQVCVLSTDKFVAKRLAGKNASK